MTREETILSLASQVKAIASLMHRRLPPGRGRVPFDDLLSEAWIGAIQAVDRFDPSLGIKLGTFADRRIKGAIGDYLRSIDPLTRKQRKDVKAGKECPIRIVGMQAVSPDPRHDAEICTRQLVDERENPSRNQGLDRRDIERLYRACGLDARHRFVLEQCAVEVPGKQTGARIGVKQSRVSNMYQTGLKKMRAAAGVA